MSGKAFFLAILVLPGMILALDPGFGEGAEAASESWAPIAIGGGRFFFCLIAGILLALAVQWILTSLSLATGISLRRRGEARNEAGTPAIEAKAGLWTLASTCVSLFCSAWAAAELIRFGTPVESVILGLTIWAGFLITLIWLEASVLGYLSGNVIGAFKAGLKGMGLPIQAFNGETDRAAFETSAIAARVREEFRSRGRKSSLRDNLREYLDVMGAREPDRFEIDRESKELFEDQELQSMARRGNLQRVDRNRFRELIASRGDITEEESGQWAEALIGRWDGLREEGAGSLAETAAESVAEAAAVEAPVAGAAAAGETPAAGKAASKAAEPESAEGALGTVKVDTIVSAPADFKERLKGFKEFLRNSDRRELNPVRLEQEVETLVASPEESLATLEAGARSVKRDEMVQVLKQRRDISPQEADSIADLIDSARTRTLSRSEMREHRMQEATDNALARLRDRIYSLKRPARDYDGFRQDVERMLEDPGVDFESLKSDLHGMDRQSLFNMFYAKRGISKQDAERMAESAEMAIEHAKDTSLKIEAETLKRVEESRIGAEARTEAAHAMAASAAWWMFGISLAAGAAAALGGWMGSRT